jgi:hypothetical protein
MALDAIAVAASAGAWDALRRDQGLSVARARAAMTTTLTSLLRGEVELPALTAGFRRDEA